MVHCVYLLSGHHFQRHLTVSNALILYFCVLCTVYRLSFFVCFMLLYHFIVCFMCGYLMV